MTDDSYSKILEVEIDRLRARLVDLEGAIAAENEACAKVVESYEPRCDSCPRGAASAIRDRLRGKGQGLVERSTFHWMYPNGADGLK